MFGWFGGKDRSPGTEPGRESITPLPEEPPATTDDPGYRAGGPDPDLARLKNCVRRLDQPSAWTALPHTIELAAPSEAALILWVKAEIARVGSAVDEWTADELDDLIRTQQATWDAKAKEHAAEQRKEIDKLLTQETHDLDEAIYAVSRFQADADEQSESVTALRGELLGTEPSHTGSADRLASADGDPRRSGTGWRDRILGLSVTGQETRSSRIAKKALVFGMLLLGLALDATLAVPALELVFAYDRTTTFFLALMLAAFGTAAAATAGHAARGAQAAGSLGGRVWAATLALIWLALGGLISLIRVVAAEESAAQPWESVDSGLGAEALVPALTFFIVWLACGALAAHDMYTSRNDAQAKREIAAAALENSIIQLAWLEPLEARLAAAVEVREAQLDDVEAALDRAIARHAALADRLTAEARHELAVQHGDPAFTGITSVLHPDHPRTVREPASQAGAPQPVESPI